MVWASPEGSVSTSRVTRSKQRRKVFRFSRFAETSKPDIHRSMVRELRRHNHPLIKGAKMRAMIILATSLTTSLFIAGCGGSEPPSQAPSPSAQAPTPAQPAPANLKQIQQQRVGDYVVTLS